MSDWTPKEIDQLFQEGSKKHEFEYNEAAWGKMEILLDDRDRRKKRLLWWFIGGLLSILLIGGIYFFKLTCQTKQTQQKIEITNQPTKKLSANERLGGVSTKKHLIPSKENNVVSNSAKEWTKRSSQKENASFDNAALKSINSKEKHVLSAKQTATTTVIPKVVLPTSNANRLAAEVTSTGKVTNPLRAESSINQTTQNAAEANHFTLVAKKRATQSMVDALPTLSNTIDLAEQPILLDTSFLKENEDRKNNQKKVTNNHFVVGLSVGRELSFVDVGLCDPNWKVGLSLAYRFGGKHSLKIEGSYSKKEYAASGDQYIAPQGFWEDGILPQMTIGTCNILETSITESYFFKGHSAKGVYVNLGLTSYFMLRERYNYSYDVANQGSRSTWGTRNTNRHWFGIGEIAVGYNLPFSNKTSLQIAPYAQILSLIHISEPTRPY